MSTHIRYSINTISKFYKYLRMLKLSELLHAQLHASNVQNKTSFDLHVATSNINVLTNNSTSSLTGPSTPRCTSDIRS